jgi:hypothetical protein
LKKVLTQIPVLAVHTQGQREGNEIHAWVVCLNINRCANTFKLGTFLRLVVLKVQKSELNFACY